MREDIKRYRVGHISIKRRYRIGRIILKRILSGEKSGSEGKD